MPDSPCSHGRSHWGLCDICNAAGKACTPVLPDRSILPEMIENDIPILCAALLAMVEDNHCAQDQLTAEEWLRASDLCKCFIEAEGIRRGSR